MRRYTKAFSLSLNLAEPKINLANGIARSKVAQLMQDRSQPLAFDARQMWASSHMTIGE
jgi:hypothetical protein